MGPNSESSINLEMCRVGPRALGPQAPGPGPRAGGAGPDGPKTPVGGGAVIDHCRQCSTTGRPWSASAMVDHDQPCSPRSTMVGHSRSWPTIVEHSQGMNWGVRGECRVRTPQPSLETGLTHVSKKLDYQTWMEYLLNINRTYVRKILGKRRSRQNHILFNQSYQGTQYIFDTCVILPPVRLETCPILVRWASMIFPT